MAKCKSQITNAKMSNDSLWCLVRKTCDTIIDKENNKDIVNEDGQESVFFLDIGLLKSEQRSDLYTQNLANNKSDANNDGINKKDQKSNDDELPWNSNYTNVPILLATNKMNRNLERVCGGAETSEVSETKKEDYHHPPADEHGHGSLQNFERREQSLHHLYTPSIRSNGSQGITFEEWLMGKKRMFAERATKSRQMKAAFEEALEQRRLLAAQKYDEWLSEKIEKKRLSGEKSKNSLGVHARDHLTQEEMDQRVQEWEHRKQKEIEQKREERRLDAEMQRQRMKWRKTQSDAAWKTWLARVDKRRSPMLASQEFSSLSDNAAVMFSDSHGWEPIDESSEEVQNNRLRSR